MGGRPRSVAHGRNAVSRGELHETALAPQVVKSVNADGSGCRLWPVPQTPSPYPVPRVRGRGEEGGHGGDGEDGDVGLGSKDAIAWVSR